MNKTKNQVDRDAFIAASCARVSQSRNYLGVLKPATFLAYQSEMRARGLHINYADALAAVEEAERGYKGLIAGMEGDLLANNPARHTHAFLDALGTVPLFRGYPQIIDKVLQGSEEIMRWQFGPVLKWQYARDLVLENRRLQGLCEQTFQKVYDASITDPNNTGLFYAGLLESTGVSTDPLAPAVLNLSRNLEAIKADGVLASINRDGTLNTDDPRLLRSIERQQEQILSQITENAKAIADVGSGVGSIHDQIALLRLEGDSLRREMQRREAAAMEAQKKQIFDQLQVEAARSAVFLFSRIVGGKNGQQIERTGNATIAIWEAASKYRSTVTALQGFSWATSMATLTFTGNVVGAVLSLFSGRSADEMILGQLQAIRDDIATLGGYLSERFNLLDQRLTAMYADLTAGLDDVLRAGDRIEDNVQRVTARLNALYDLTVELGIQQSRLFEEAMLIPINADMEDAARLGREFKAGRLERINDEEFNRYRQSFVRLTNNIAKADAALNGHSRLELSPLRSPAEAWRSSRRLLAGSGLPEERLQQICSPVLWIVGVNALVDLVYNFWPQDRDLRARVRTTVADVILIAQVADDTIQGHFFDAEGKWRFGALGDRFSELSAALDALNKRMIVAANYFSTQKFSQQKIPSSVCPNPNVFAPFDYGGWRFDMEALAARSGVPPAVFNFFAGTEVETLLTLGMASLEWGFEHPKFEGVFWTQKQICHTRGRPDLDNPPVCHWENDKVHGYASATLWVDCVVGPQVTRYRMVTLRLTSKEASWLSERAFTDPIIPDPSRPALALEQFNFFWSRDMRHNVSAFAVEVGTNDRTALSQIASRQVASWFSGLQCDFYTQLPTALAAEIDAFKQARFRIEQTLVIGAPNASERSDVLRSAFLGSGNVMDEISLIQGVKDEANKVSGTAAIGLTNLFTDAIKKVQNYIPAIESIMSTVTKSSEKHLLFKEGIDRLAAIHKAMEVVPE